MTLFTQTQILERLNQASSLLMQRRPADAAAVLERVVEANPEVVEASRLFGVALRLAGDLAGAERVLRASLGREKSAGVFLALAETLELAQRRPEAEQAFRSALAATPFFPDAAIGLSELLLNENRVADALAVIAPVGRRTDADIHALSAYALALKASEQFDEAIAVYSRAVARNPNSAAAEHNLAAALADASRYAEAEGAARRALAKGIDAPQTWLTLARALQGLDRYDEAELVYRKAIERDPTSADAQAELAQLLWMRTEDLPAASATISRAIAADSQNVPLIAAKAKLYEYAGDSGAAYAVLD